MKVIVVDAAYRAILEELATKNRIHSIFETGLNLLGKRRLVYLGWDLDGGLPREILIARDSFEKLGELCEKTSSILRQGP